MACPICLAVDNTPLVAGLRDGAFALIIVALVVGGSLARLAWRLWLLDQRVERRAAGPDGRE